MIYKRSRCDVCKKIVDHQQPPRIAPDCAKCGATSTYMEKWYIQWTEAGKRHTRAVSRKKKNAEIELGKILSSIAEGKSALNKERRFSWAEAVEEFTAWYTVNTKSVHMFPYAVKVLTTVFRHQYLNDIQPMDVERYKTTRLAAGLATSTINKEIMTLKRMCNLLLEHNPIASVRKLEEPEGRIRVLTDNELDQLIGEVKTNYLLIAIHLGLNTGLRKKNIITLRWDNIVWDEGVIRTRLVKKKNSPTITIPMTVKLKNELLKYRQSQFDTISAAEKRATIEKGTRKAKALAVARRAEAVAASPYLFPSRDDTSKSMRADAKIGFKAACDRAKIEDFRFHDLRHTFASKFAMATGDLGTLKDLLGHSDIKMTMRYSHFSNDHKKARMEQFEAMAQTQQQKPTTNLQQQPRVSPVNINKNNGLRIITNAS